MRTKLDIKPVDEWYTATIHVRDADTIDVALWPSQPAETKRVKNTRLHANRKGGHFQMAKIMIEQNGDELESMPQSRWLGGGVTFDSKGKLNKIFLKSGLNGIGSSIDNPSKKTDKELSGNAEEVFTNVFQALFGEGECSFEV